MTELFAMPVHCIDPDDRTLRACLSPARLERLDRLHGTARAQSFAASLLLEHAVRCLFPSVPHPLESAAQPDGKPYLIGAPQVQFNLSHAGDWAVCAVGSHPVGVDIEQCRAGRRDVARRFFHPDEVQYLDTLSPAARTDAFYTLWTLKESYVKADGRGLRLLRHFCVDLSGAPRVAGDETASLFRIDFPDPDYRLSLCVRQKNAAPPPLTLLHR